MFTASIKSLIASEKVECHSDDIDLTMYKFAVNKDIIKIFKDDELLIRTNCLDSLEYPLGKKWHIHRRYGGKLFDKVIDAEGNKLLQIERDYRYKAGTFLNNYLKIDVAGCNSSIFTEFKQWRLFFPIKVKAWCEMEVNPDLWVISLLLSWFRYEYGSHDQVY